MEIGDVLWKLRKRSGLAQRNIEKSCGLKRAHLSKIETNGLKNPTIKTVRKIVGALGLKMSDVFLFLEQNKISEAVAEKFQRPPVNTETLRETEKAIVSLEATHNAGKCVR